MSGLKSQQRRAEEAGRLITRILENQSAGRPLLDTAAVPFARRWLERILVDSASLRQHLELLQQGGGLPFAAPPRRRDRQAQAETPQTAPEPPRDPLLPEPVAVAIVEGGPAAFDAHDAPDVGRLLLNPFALCELADLIDVSFPGAWMDRLAEVGKEAWSEQRRRELRPAREKLGSLGVSLGGRTDCRLLPFEGAPAQALERRIAEQLYGEGEHAFSLRLGWDPGRDEADQVRPFLEVAPPPTRGPLVIRVAFPGGEWREFTFLAGALEGSLEDWARAGATEPLPAEAVIAPGEGQWSPGWPPEFRLG